MMKLELPDWVARRYEKEQVEKLLENPTPEPEPEVNKTRQQRRVEKIVGRNMAFGVKMTNGMRVKGNMSTSIKTRRRRAKV